MVYAYNQRSCRLLERRGFKLEGTLRDAAFKDGRFTDSLVYGLLRREAAAGTGGVDAGAPRAGAAGAGASSG